MELKRPNPRSDNFINPDDKVPSTLKEKIACPQGCGSASSMLLGILLGGELNGISAD